jgi:CelD/BcsL family acetyltransferase involved in cellulose biosynthesis
MGLSGHMAAAPPLIVTAAAVPDWEALGAEWQGLEARASFTPFQGWGWVGCLAAERYDAPLLLRAEAAGRLVGLALFNRRRGALHFSESGDPERDRPFIEHNAPLVVTDAPPDTAAALLRVARTHTRRLVLGGVPPALAAAAGGLAWRQELRDSPYICLDAVRAAGGDWLATLGASTRYQIRRSDRLYGELAVEAAATPTQAAGHLAELMALHDRRWGERGAFATPWLRRFHAALVERLASRGELDMLRVSAGGAAVGLLYNFRRDGRVFAYQSGWAEPTDAHRKPGLTCHHAAIRLALARGERVYDLLAGGQRYKRNLARDSAPLAWVELVPALSLRGAVLGWRRLIRGRGRATAPRDDAP